jgi:type I restriction enzyme, R subunit
LKNLGARTLALSYGDAIKLDPITDAGSGMLQEKQKAYMSELIAKLNEVFGTETSVQDQLRYVNGIILGKTLESVTLQQQAANNTKEQFKNSPDLSREVTNTVISAMDAHSIMSTQALNSPIVLRGIIDVLLNHSGLYESLRLRAGVSGEQPSSALLGA